MFNIPKDIEILIEKLEKKGFKAYLAGGCVRDTILNKTPHDYDIATDATPDEIEGIFSSYKTLEVGKAFGTILVVTNSGNVEITTFRADGVYLDGRKPDRVSFSKSLEEDLKRRDFTINAMVYSKREGIIDYFNGREDIENRIIRTVGNPEERFAEDHLRMLRAVRFASTLSFKIEDETMEAIKNNSGNLKGVSRERIREEWIKMLNSNNPGLALELLIETGLINIVFPDFNVWAKKNPEKYADLKINLEKSERDFLLRMMIFFGMEGSLSDLLGIVPTNREVSFIKELRNFKFPSAIDDFSVKLIMGNLTEEKLRYILLTLAFIGEDKKSVEIFLNSYERIIKSHEPYLLRDLAINGEDIISTGIHEGKKVGEILRDLYIKVLKKPSLNNREELLKSVNLYRGE